MNQPRRTAARQPVGPDDGARSIEQVIANLDAACGRLTGIPQPDSSPEDLARLGDRVYRLTQRLRQQIARLAGEEEPPGCPQVEDHVGRTRCGVR